MKKLNLLLVFLTAFTFSCFSQDLHILGVETLYTQHIPVTTAERDALNFTSNDRVVLFNTTTNQIEFWDGDSWELFGADNLGNHTATQNIGMSGYSLINSSSIQISNPISENDNIESWDLETINGSLILKGTGGSNGSTTPSVAFSDTDRLLQLPASNNAAIDAGSLDLAVTKRWVQDYLTSNSGFSPFDNLDDSPADQNSTEIKFDGIASFGDSAESGFGQVNIRTENNTKDIALSISNYLPAGANKSYTYGTYKTNRITDGGDVGSFLGEVTSLRITGNTTTTVPNLFRAVSPDIRLQNPNATVISVQGYHDNFILDAGTVTGLDTANMLLDKDINQTNLDNGTLLVNDDDAFLHIYGGSDVEYYKTFQAGRGYKVRAIYSGFTGESDFAGIINYTGDLSNIENATNEVLTPKGYVKDNFIPITGTNIGNPVIGNIEVIDGVKMFSDNASDNFGLHLKSKPVLYFQNSDGKTQVEVEEDAVFATTTNSVVNFKGFAATEYLGANYDDNTYVQKKYVDDEIAAASIGGGAGSVSKMHTYLSPNGGVTSGEVSVPYADNLNITQTAVNLADFSSVLSSKRVLPIFVPAENITITKIILDINWNDTTDIQFHVGIRDFANNSTSPASNGVEVFNSQISSSRYRNFKTTYTTSDWSSFNSGVFTMSEGQQLIIGIDENTGNSGSAIQGITITILYE